VASPYDKNFDDILEEILIDYQNLDNAPDTGEGSTPFIMGSVLASMIYGLYRYQDYINRQHFPDSADTEHLNRWGVIYDISRLTDESDSAYLERILDFIRTPPAGGNNDDFRNWALDQEYSYFIDGDSTYYNAYATCVNQDDGPGTVGVYLIPNDETIIDSTNAEGLRAATEDYITGIQPLGIVSTGVHISHPQAQAIDATVYSASSLDTDSMSSAIVDEINAMSPGQSLYRSTITCILTSYGADYAIVNNPSSDINTIDSTYFYRTDSSIIDILEATS